MPLIPSSVQSLKCCGEVMHEDLTELETRLAFQDDALQSLNETVIRQQQEIQELKLELAELKERLQEIAETEDGRKEEAPPPHY